MKELIVYKITKAEQIRRSLGMSMKQFAEAVGVTTDTIVRLEKKRRCASMRTIKKIIAFAEKRGIKAFEMEATETQRPIKTSDILIDYD